MDRACSTYGRDEKCEVAVGKPQEQRPLRRHRRRGEDNIKMELRETVVNWIHLIQDRNLWRDLVKTVMNLRVL
jgi:hypothetical protein